MKIEIRNISLSAGPKRLLADIEATLDSRQITVILGPNGAGKSTLLRVIGGVAAADTGEVLFAGKSVHQMPLAERAQQLAVLTQKTALDFPFTAAEVVGMGRSPFGRVNTDDPMVVELLTTLGIEAGQSYLSLSGGERQLVQLARVFAQIWHRPSDAYLLLDEPMTALDLKHQVLVTKLLRQLASHGLGQLVVMHDINLAAAIADRIVLMSGGQILAFGTPDEVLTEDRLQATFQTPVKNVAGQISHYFTANAE